MGEMATDADNGRPQPASGPMDKETADWYVRYTDGQFQTFLADDGNWYLYLATSVSAEHSSRRDR
jgi:hypothetical protein